MTKTEKEILNYEKTSWGIKFTDLPIYARKSIECDIDYEKGILTLEELFLKKMEIHINYAKENNIKISLPKL